jgi:tyrosyl-tRNA synthetase
MGRTEHDSLDFSQLLYPSMQSVDIKAMDLDIVHAGTDQRKIHMLVREVFPKLGWKVPVSVHHHILPGLTDPNMSTNSSIERNSEDAKIFTKMSKSNPSGSILIHDNAEEISTKVKKAYCPSKITQNNPILEIINYVIFHEFEEFILERPTKYGGNISYYSFDELKVDFENGRIHPMDLKMSTSIYLDKIIAPVRNYLENDYRKTFQS